eukprot:4165519-Prymnesium_polylepis.1
MWCGGGDAVRGCVMWCGGGGAVRARRQGVEAARRRRYPLVRLLRVCDGDLPTSSRRPPRRQHPPHTLWPYSRSAPPAL